MEETVITLEEDIAAEVSNRCYSIKHMILREISSKWDIAQLEPLPMLPVSGIAIRSRIHGSTIAVIRIAKKSIRLYRVLGVNTMEFDEVVRIIDQYVSAFKYYVDKSLDDNTCLVWRASRIRKPSPFLGERHSEVVPGTILVARVEDSRHILFGTQWFVQVIERTDSRCTVRSLRGKPCGNTTVPGIFFEYMPYPGIFDDMTLRTFTLPEDTDELDTWFANLKKGVSVRPWNGKPILYNDITGV